MKMAVLLGVCTGLALMVFALVSVTFAESWFSLSNYAYFIGDIDSWGEEIDSWVDGEVRVDPEDEVLGNDPCVSMFCATKNPDPSIWRGFCEEVWLGCAMVNISMVEFNYDGKDFYLSGTWGIQKLMWKISTENITDIAPFVDEMLQIRDIADIAVITYESNITGIIDFAAAEFEEADMTVFYLTEENGTNLGWSWSDDVGFTLEINDEVVGSFDLIISGDLYSNVIEVDPPRSRKIRFATGDLYVTGNWTDFAAEIEGFGMFSGKVLDYDVKNDGTVSVARTDVNHNRKIDIHDVAKVARAYGSTVGSSLYDPDLDLNSDSIINVVDLVAVARNFGKTY
jgi:hypothetical protein